MCGFAGQLGSANLPAERLAELGTQMAGRLRHRGPDDAGCWVNEPAGLVLAFRRLSILDLSPHGHQPMSSEGGRFTVVFNGEIYNHRELRRQLESEGARFRGTSDTEVMLALLDHP